MSLFSLPNELLIQIGKELDPEDLDRFIRTNRHLATLLTPVLHKIAVHAPINLSFGKTVLEWAVMNGHVRLISSLLDYGCDIEASHELYTPLMVATIHGQKAAILLLIDRGANIDARCKFDSRTVLHCAAMKGEVEAANIFLEMGADVDATSSDGETPLHLAVKFDFTECSRLLLEKGANIDAQKKAGETALQMAAETGNEELFLEFCGKGADITLCNDKMDILHTVLAHGGTERMVKALLEKNVEMSYNPCTVLHTAIDGGVSVKVFELLLDAGAEVCIPIRELPYGQTPLHLAASGRGPLRYCGPFLSRRVGDEGDTALDSSGDILTDAETRREAIARMLVDRGADIHVVDNSGGTPLHAAARNGYAGMVKIFIENGAKVATRDGQLYTALHRAAEGSCENRYQKSSGNIAVMRLLLENGADINDYYGTRRGTVRDWGSSGNKFLCDFLEELGQDVDELRAYQTDLETEGEELDYDDIDFDLEPSWSDIEDVDGGDNEDDDELSWDGYGSD